MDYSLDGDDGDAQNEYADLAENQEEPEFAQKDAILFVVDARQEMYESGANGSPSPLAQALGCVQASMQRRIQAGDTDLVGLLLFGTKQQKAATGQLEFPFTYVQQELPLAPRAPPLPPPALHAPPPPLTSCLARPLPHKPPATRARSSSSRRGVRCGTCRACRGPTASMRAATWMPTTRSPSRTSSG